MRGVDERNEAGGSLWRIQTPPGPFGPSPLVNEGGKKQVDNLNIDAKNQSPVGDWFFFGVLVVVYL